MDLHDIKNKFSCSSFNCFKNNFFKTNFKSGIVNHVNYNGLSIEQNPHIVENFNKLIKEYKPQRILEIGTFHGGLTEIIRDLLDLNGLVNSEIKTYDVLIHEFTKQKFKNKNISLVEKNLFTYSYTDFLDYTSKQELIDFIKSPGVTIVLCDGGSKKNEFNLISELIKFGDIIMAHDYAPNQKYFEEEMINNFWNWMEIQDSDIEGSCLKYNLKPLLQDFFIEVGWVCKIKN